MTNREKVLARYPKPVCWQHDSEYVVWMSKHSTFALGEGDTEEAAWADAVAKRIEQEQKA